MTERPIPIEFAPIKQNYLRHLETGEPPNLKDLIEQTKGTKLQEFLRDLVLTTYMKTGRVGIHPDVPNLQEEMDSFGKMIDGILDLPSKLSPDLQQLIFGPYKPKLRVVKTDSRKPKTE